MATLTTFLGWIALLAFGACFASLFYTYYAAKRLMSAVAKGALSDALLSGEAETALEKGARARIKWLKVNQARLPEDIKDKVRRALWVDATCQWAFWILVVLWLLTMLLGEKI